MPIFDYHCHECDKDEERIVRHEQSRIQKCETCGELLSRSDVHPVNGHVAVVTGARLWDGRTIPGRFGKPNKNKRRQTL